MEKEIYRIIYKVDRNKEQIRILYTDFVKNNKNKGKLIIKNIKYNYKDFIKINGIKSNNIKIKMIFSHDICNASYMFKNCSSLLEFKIYNDIENIYDIEFLEMEKNKNLFFAGGTIDEDIHPIYKYLANYN